MYYRKKIPASFQQLPQPELSAETEESPAVPLTAEEKKPPLQKHMDASPLAALLLLDYFRQK